MNTDSNGQFSKLSEEDSLGNLSQETVDLNPGKRKASAVSDTTQSDKKRTKIDVEEEAAALETIDFLSETLNSKICERRDGLCLQAPSSTDVGACREDTSSATNSVTIANRHCQWNEKDLLDQPDPFSECEPEISEEEFQKCIEAAQKGIVLRPVDTPSERRSISSKRKTGKQRKDSATQKESPSERKLVLTESPFSSPSKRTLTERVAAAERHIKALTKEKQRLQQIIESNRTRLNKLFTENQALKKDGSSLAAKLISLSEKVQQLQTSLDLQKQIIG